MNREEAMGMVERKKLIVILRKVPLERTQDTVKALYRAGVRALEFTFDHDSADVIGDTVKKVRMALDMYPDMLVGCGTVLTRDEVQAAFAAGARLIISPNTDVQVIEETRRLGAVSMPGAMTPTEIVQAANAGADYVKLFPAGELGLKYIKAVRGPLMHIKMTAVGGVTSANVGEFLNAGMSGFGVGGQIIDAKAIAAGEYDVIYEKAFAFTDAIARWKYEKESGVRA